jgi:uncharacterized protein YneF (UPF0154 family)
MIEFLKTVCLAGLWTILALLAWGFVLGIAVGIFHGLRTFSRELKKLPWGVRR